MKIYLLNVTPLLEEEIFQKALSFVDVQRAEKVKALKVRKEQARSLGAGLLLQYGLLEKLQNSEIETRREVVELTVEKILENKQRPIEISLCLKENQKPYFSEPFQECFFSISHSQDYAACAFSEKEIGIDLQYKREDIRVGLAGYLFTERENALLSRCKSMEEYQDLFYTLFSAKEAYIKLTGQGMRQKLKALEVILDKKKMVDADTQAYLADLKIYVPLKEYSLVVSQKSSGCIQ